MHCNPGDEPDREEFKLSKSYKFVIGAMTIARPWSHTPKSLHNQVAFFTIILAGGLVYWHWEAMLISYLSVRTITLPFRSLEDLLYNTDYKVDRYWFNEMHIGHK